VAVLVLDVLNEVLSILGVYAPGENITAADSQSMLFTLNGILDGLGAEIFAIVDHPVYAFPVVGSKQAYTLGPDASNDWVTPTLPASIVAVSVLVGALEVSLAPLNTDEWQAIGIKSFSGGVFPSGYWLQYGAAFHTLNFFPMPSSTNAVRLYCDSPLTSFTAVTNTVAMPAGYQEFLTYDLAIKSAGKFGKSLPGWLPEARRDARSRIKEANYTPIYSRCDDALLAGGGGLGGGSMLFASGGGATAGGAGTWGPSTSVYVWGPSSSDSLINWA